MKKFLFGGAAAACVVAGTAAFAQAPAPVSSSPYRPLVQKAVTRAEVQAKVAQHFARLDANRDGFVTKAEAEAMKAQRQQMRNGKRAEVQGKRFDRLDSNDDGAISRGEFDAHQQQRLAKRDRNGDGKPDRRLRGMRGMGMGMIGGRMFDMADGNRDGRLTLQEASSAALQHFDMADANRDGQISAEERQQMRQRMRAQHQQHRG